MSPSTELSIMVPAAPAQAEQLLPYAELVKAGAARRLWQGQSSAMDPLGLVAAAAGRGLGVPTGFGVSLLPLQHPYHAALQMRTLSTITGHSVIAGFGPAAVGFQASLGSRYPSPLTACREYVTILRELLAGRTAQVAGDVFTCHNAMAPVSSPSISVGLGVLRPGMARLAGEVADVAITWLTPPHYVRDVLIPAMDEGAQKAGRSRPKVTAMMPMALAGEGRRASDVVWGSCSGHAALPHYADVFDQAGLRLDPLQPESCTEQLTASGTVPYGTPQQVREHVARYLRAGVDEVVLSTVGVLLTEGPRRAYEETRNLLEVLR